MNFYLGVTTLIRYLHNRLNPTSCDSNVRFKLSMLCSKLVGLLLTFTNTSDLGFPLPFIVVELIANYEALHY